MAKSNYKVQATETGTWNVVIPALDGTEYTESAHTTEREARRRAMYLNGVRFAWIYLPCDNGFEVGFIRRSGEWTTVGRTATKAAAAAEVARRNGL